MPARANVTLADGESTPVDHIFTPDGDVAPDVARFINRNASVPAASEVFTVSPKASSASVADLSEPGKKVAPRVTEFRLRMPVTYVDGVSGLTLIDYVNEAIFSFKVHPRASEQQVENLRVMARTAIGQAPLVVCVDKGEKIW